MGVLAKYVTFVNISRGAFLLLIQCLFIYWYLRRPQILDSYEKRLFSYSTRFSNNSFPISPYHSLYPEQNPDVVLTFLHIQKNGGTYIEANLIRPGVFGFPCNCPNVTRGCRCYHDGRVWLASRFSVGWLCGVHPDLTALQECLPAKLTQIERFDRPRRIVYFTILRDAVSRYLSEWIFIRRKDSFWEGATLQCQGRQPSVEQYQPCPYVDDVDLSNLSFERYANCSLSLSNNRQTRMMASLNRLGCYANLSEWTRPMPGDTTSLSSLSPAQVGLVESAVDNLVTAIATFGLQEHIPYTQYMYQQVIGLVFRVPLAQSNGTRAESAPNTPGYLPPNWRAIAEARNRLDIIFIRIARHLFANRLRMRLRADSGVLPVRMRLLLRRLENPPVLLDDGELKKLLVRHLRRYFVTKVRRRKRLESAQAFADSPPVSHL